MTATLGELRQFNGVIHGECTECGRAREIPARDERLQKLPDDLPVGGVGHHMRCRDCKGRRILTTVAPSDA